MVYYVRTTIELMPWQHAQVVAEAKALGRSMASLLGERITRNAIATGVTRLPVYTDPATGRHIIDAVRGKGLTPEEEAALIADYELRYPGGREHSTGATNDAVVSTES